MTAKAKRYEVHLIHPDGTVVRYSRNDGAPFRTRKQAELKAARLRQSYGDPITVARARPTALLDGGDDA